MWSSVVNGFAVGIDKTSLFNCVCKWSIDRNNDKSFLFDCGTVDSICAESIEAVSIDDEYVG